VGGTALDATVEVIEVAVSTIPTDAPEADGTLAWDSPTMVLVEVRSGEIRETGWSWVRGHHIPRVKIKIGESWGTARGRLPLSGRLDRVPRTELEVI
jgi:hypothetical protein